MSTCRRADVECRIVDVTSVLGMNASVVRLAAKLCVEVWGWLDDSVWSRLHSGWNANLMEQFCEAAPYLLE